MSKNKNISFTELKRMIGKRVNIRLKNGSVIVNVLLFKYILSADSSRNHSKIVIKHNSKEEEIPVFSIKEIEILVGVDEKHVKV